MHYIAALKSYFWGVSLRPSFRGQEFKGTMKEKNICKNSLHYSNLACIVTTNSKNCICKCSLCNIRFMIKPFCLYQYKVDKVSSIEKTIQMINLIVVKVAMTIFQLLKCPVIRNFEDRILVFYWAFNFSRIRFISNLDVCCFFFTSNVLLMHIGS